MHYEFLSKVVGYLLRQKRMELNYTQNDVCKAASISQGQLSRIENGARIPSLSLFIRLCKILGCDLSIKEIEKHLSDLRLLEKEEKEDKTKDT